MSVLVTGTTLLGVRLGDETNHPQGTETTTGDETNHLLVEGTILPGGDLKRSAPKIWASERSRVISHVM